MTITALFTGVVEECNGFLLQCLLALEMQPHLYTTDRAKIAFIISLLTGRALQWAETIWTQSGTVTQSVNNFIEHFNKKQKCLVDRPVTHPLESNRIISVNNLCLLTIMLSNSEPLRDASGWNDHSLLTTYRQGLEPRVRLQLSAYDHSVIVCNQCHPYAILFYGIPKFSTSIESPREKQSFDIPTCYAPFSNVFCLKRASQLPPHRPWDCAIYLLPGELVPCGRIYPLSLPEQKAREEYIEEALQQGYICPSTSPAASSFFFLAKKDGSLQRCIDYRTLNKIRVKLPYPLPLVPAAFQHLRKATVFCKLDLRSMHNLIRIHDGDEWKTAFVTPTGH